MRGWLGMVPGRHGMVKPGYPDWSRWFKNECLTVLVGGLKLFAKTVLSLLLVVALIRIKDVNLMNIMKEKSITRDAE